MNKKNLLSFIFVAMFFATTLTFGQHQYRPLPIYRYLTCSNGPDTLNVMDLATISLDSTDITWAGWDTLSNATTNHMWWVKNYNSLYELEVTGYGNSTNNPSDQWLVSPFFSTKLYHGVALSLASSCAKYAGPKVEVLISKNYRSGAPSTATWDSVPGLNIVAPNGTASTPFTPSGIAILDSWVGDSVCIALHYYSTSGAAATYYFDQVQITGIVTGIDEINTAEKNISVYPNPATSSVTISDSHDLIKKIEIYNMIGELVSSYMVNNTKYTINTTDLKQGLYFAKIQLKNETIVSKKIIKE